MAYKQRSKDLSNIASKMSSHSTNGPGDGDESSESSKNNEDSWSSLFSEMGSAVKEFFTSEKPKQFVDPKYKSSHDKNKENKQTGGSGALPFLEGSNPLDRTGIYKRN